MPEPHEQSIEAVDTVRRNDAASLGDWIREQLAAESPDTVFITRVVTQELSRWFASPSAVAQIPELIAVAPDTGSQQSNAFLEGAVAYVLHAHEMKAPAWASRTMLDVGWAPNDHLYRSDDWYAIAVLGTPVEFLHRGVVFPRSNFRRL